MLKPFPLHALFFCSLLQRQQLVPQRGIATAALAAVAASGSDAGEGPLGVGSLLEFERDKSYLLGRAIKQLAQGWQVEVPR